MKGLVIRDLDSYILFTIPPNAHLLVDVSLDICITVLVGGEVNLKAWGQNVQTSENIVSDQSGFMFAVVI